MPDTATATALALLKIAGYTWYKTYITIEGLGRAELDAARTLTWLEHKQSELNFASLIVRPPPRPAPPRAPR